MTKKLRVTASKVKVLQVMLDDPSADHWGYQLMEQSGVKSGSLYPILRQLEDVGWVESHRESINREREGRPPRRYYKLTGLGERAASTAVIDFYSGFRSPPAAFRPGVAT